MTPLKGKRLLRWTAAPLLAAAAVLATLTSVPIASASDHPRLPARTAAQLLAAIQQADAQHFSGTVKTSTKLGLPSLPDSFAGGSGLSPQTLLTGSHTYRVWVRGAEQQRLALISDLAETDVVHNNTDLWTYDSQNMRVTHATLSSSPDHAAATRETTAETPAAAADHALKAIDPSTAVTVDRTARVAGRPAYELVLTPRDTRTLVGRVQIAIDSKTSLPLRVRVFARGASHPAFDVGFSSIGFGTPKASIFHFTPPKGSKVEPATVSSFLSPGAGAGVVKQPETKPSAPHETNASPRIIGSGWTAVAVIDAGRADQGTSKIVEHAGTRVPGGELIKTALVSVLIADDGHIYVGAVTGTHLETVARTGRAL